MVITLAVAVGSAVGGYLYGNGKLSAVKAEVAKIETEVVTDAKAVIARIKAKL